MAVPGVLNRFRVKIPVSWMIRDVEAKGGQYCLDECFHFSTIMCVIGFCEEVVHVEDLSDVLKEPRD